MPTDTLSSTQQLIQELRSYALPRFAKRAALGGDGRDTSFEQAFSNLGHAFIRDKAPSLLEYEVGFQLVDRSEDNTKAVGIMGFKVGPQWLYAPIFWLNGDLKGHELLYLKSQDMFVPLKENWLNYIMSRRPHELGHGVDRNTSQLGVLRPDLNRLSKAPNKIASANISFSQRVRDDVMPVFAHIVTTAIKAEPKYAKLASFPEFLGEQSLEELDLLVKAAQQYPIIAEKLEQFYGLSTIGNAIKVAAARHRVGDSVLSPVKQAAARVRGETGSVLSQPHPIKKGSLKVITPQTTSPTADPSGLDEEDQEKLLRDGMLIQDHREGDEVSTPYNLQVEAKLTNPTESGLYRVLVSAGHFERCFVAMHPHGPDGRKRFCTVVRLDGDKNWLNCHPSFVWVAEGTIPGQDNTSDSDLDMPKWIEGLPTTKPTGKTRFMVLHVNGNATVPLRIDEELEDEFDKPVLAVSPSDSADWDYSQRSTMEYGIGSVRDRDTYSVYRDGCRLHFDGKNGTTLRSSMGDIYAPQGCHVLKVEPDVVDKKRDKDEPMSECCFYGGYGHSEKKPIRLRNPLDRHLSVLTDFDMSSHEGKTKKDGDEDTVLDSKAKDDSPKHNDSEKDAFVLGDPKQVQKDLQMKLASLTVWSDSLEVEVNRHRMSKKAGFIHLVRDHGFREEVAYELLKQAEHRNKITVSVVYPAWWHATQKSASPFLTDSQPQSVPFPEQQYGSDPIMGSRVPTLQPQVDEQVIPGLSAANTDRDIYNPNTERDRTPMDLAQTASQASQSGQREIFDTAMIGSMLKTVRDDSMVDRYLGDIMKGLDRIGRVLFQFYWHGEEFSERYGKQDAPELEDNLRNSFEQVGDLYLQLSEKTVQPYPEEAVSSPGEDR